MFLHQLVRHYQGAWSRFPCSVSCAVCPGLPVCYSQSLTICHTHWLSHSVCGSVPRCACLRCLFFESGGLSTLWVWIMWWDCHSVAIFRSVWVVLSAVKLCQSVVCWAVVVMSCYDCDNRAACLTVAPSLHAGVYCL